MASNSGGPLDPGGGYSLLPHDATEYPPLGKITNKRRRVNDGSVQSKVMYTDAEPQGVRYLLIKPADPKAPIAENPFKLGMDIDRMAGKVIDVNRMKSGEIIVKTKSITQAKKIMKFNELPVSKTKVVIEEHKRLNQSRGKIYRYDFRSLTDEEILEGLKKQRVVGIYRQTRRDPDKYVDSGVYILTFDGTTLPTHIYAGYTRTKVTPYIPNPLRCAQCLNYGHSVKFCKGTKICARCSDIMHEGDCKDPINCANCQRAGLTDLSHSALSRECPIFKKEFEIQKIRTLQAVPLNQAKRIYESQPRPLSQKFSEVARPKKCGCLCTCKENPKEHDQQALTPVVKLMMPKGAVRSLTPTVNPVLPPLKHLTKVITADPNPITAQPNPLVRNPVNKINTPPKNDDNKSNEAIEPMSDEEEFFGFTSQELNQQNHVNVNLLKVNPLDEERHVPSNKPWSEYD